MILPATHVSKLTIGVQNVAKSILYDHMTLNMYHTTRTVHTCSTTAGRPLRFYLHMYMHTSALAAYAAKASWHSQPLSCVIA